MKYLISALLILSYPLFGETLDHDSIAYRFSAYFGLQMNYHHTSFNTLPNVQSCCPEYKDGKGLGGAFGLTYELQLPYSMFIGLSAGLSDQSGLLETFESKDVRDGNSLIKAKISHKIDVKHQDVFAEPFLVFNPFGNLELVLGAHLGYVIKKEFHQTESIVEPTDKGVFSDNGKRTRNDTTGIIPNASTIHNGVTIGIQYNLNLNEYGTLLLVPYVSYMFGLSEYITDSKWLAEGNTWKSDALRFGLQFKSVIKEIHPPVKKIEQFKEIIKIDTTTIITEDYDRNTFKQGKSIVTTKIDDGLDAKTTYNITTRTDTLFKRIKPRVNIELNVQSVQLQGRFVSEAFPLLPMIFFDINSSELTPVYTKLTNPDDFDINKIPITPIDYQKQLLNIIGLRLKIQPKANVRIYGYTDSTTERGNCELGRLRAESVKSYLMKVWGIAGDRLIISGWKKCTPKEPTFTRTESGYADNRRVELETDFDDILDPMSNQRYLEPQMINPPFIELKTTGSTVKGIKSWELNIAQDGKTYFYKSGNGYIDVIRDTIDLSKFNQIFLSKPLICKYTLTDYEGQTNSVTKEIVVNADTARYELQRLSLILFGVSSDKLTEKSKDDIFHFTSKINPDSKIEIKGYTDILGVPLHNMQISQRRAKNTAEHIKKIAPNLIIDNIKGVASDEFPPGISAYNTPIERFLSRTVYIEVLNLLKKY